MYHPCASVIIYPACGCSRMHPYAFVTHPHTIFETYVVRKPTGGAKSTNPVKTFQLEFVCASDAPCQIGPNPIHGQR